jgi:hypothetical protein
VKLEEQVNQLLDMDVERLTTQALLQQQQQQALGLPGSAGPRHGGGSIMLAGDVAQLNPTVVLRAKLSAMFDDCVSVLSEALWEGVQHAGIAHERAALLKEAMIQRDKEVEAIAAKRCKALEAQVQELNSSLKAAQQAAAAERVRCQQLHLSAVGQTEQVARQTARLQEAVQDQEALKMTVKAQASAHAAALDAQAKQHQVVRWFR